MQPNCNKVLGSVSDLQRMFNLFMTDFAPLLLRGVTLHKENGNMNDLIKEVKDIEYFLQRCPLYE